MNRRTPAATLMMVPSVAFVSANVLKYFLSHAAPDDVLWPLLFPRAG